MEVIYNLNQNFKNLSLALGFFDGVHLGHIEVIKNAVKLTSGDIKSAVVTFLKHPSEYFSNKNSKYILSQENKIKHFEKLNLDYVFFLNFDEKIANLSFENYIKDVLYANFKPKYITTGFNHFFGKDKLGNCEKLSLYENLGYSYNKIAPVKKENNIISSTSIRRFLSKGEIVCANDFLGYNFYIEGNIIKGEKLASKIGYKTANFFYPDNIIEVPLGVYATFCIIENKKYKSILNYGKKPTFKNDISIPICEVHILDFNDNIYGKKIKVEFVSKIRDEKKFGSILELSKQIENDINDASKILKIN